jgi:hypothetical protein
MKNILGRAILPLLFAVTLFAGVDATVSQSAVYKGESVDLTITAEGTEATFPDIFEIDSFPVTGTSTSQSTRFDNGAFSRTVTRIYSFTPTRDVIIPSYELTVDGKRELTKAIPVRVMSPSPAAAGSDYLLEVTLDKDEAYVGESVRLDITFKRRLDTHADRVQISEPRLEGFWAKKAPDRRQGDEGEYLTETHTYILFPQKAGDLHIPAVEAAVGTIKRSRSNSFFNDPFFDRFTDQIQWKKLFSDEVTLHVKPLPQGLELYGAFSISSEVDKDSVQANKPVNLTVTVTGEGNVEDIVKFDPVITDVITYADDPKVDGKMINGSYVGTFKQKIAIIADKDFTIPPLKLRYFDSAKQRVMTKESEPIDIKVIGSPTTQGTPKIEKSQAIAASEQTTPESESKSTTIQQRSETTTQYLYLLVGILLGALGTYLSMRYLKRVPAKQDHDLIRAIEKAKEDKKLFELLLPFGAQDPLISETLRRLEANLYTNARNTIDKRALIEWFEDHLDLLQ